MRFALLANVAAQSTPQNAGGLHRRLQRHVSMAGCSSARLSLAACRKDRCAAVQTDTYKLSRQLSLAPVASTGSDLVFFAVQLGAVCGTGTEEAVTHVVNGADQHHQGGACPIPVKLAPQSSNSWCCSAAGRCLPHCYRTSHHACSRSTAWHRQSNLGPRQWQACRSPCLAPAFRCGSGMQVCKSCKFSAQVLAWRIAQCRAAFCRSQRLNLPLRAVDVLVFKKRTLLLLQDTCGSGSLRRASLSQSRSLRWQQRRQLPPGPWQMLTWRWQRPAAAGLVPRRTPDAMPASAGGCKNSIAVQCCQLRAGPSSRVWLARV